jgi:uncharacterized protein (DUF302 family)
MEIKPPYVFGKIVKMPYASAEQKVREELAKEGFGILTEIDMKQNLSETPREEFRNQVILGACIPPVACEASSREVNLGMLPPCNVVVYTMDDASTAVMVMDPVAALSTIDNPEIDEIARKIAGKLARVLEAL